MGMLLAILALLNPAPAPNLLLRESTPGHSLRGRPIRMYEYGEAAWSGELLVFGCIHGDECGAGGVEP
ncbi:MAG TPA: hypothetical protein VNM41_06210, partial [Solirubrobacterales bacterium]|nr:hypothetical protein [Solirubrobacterales bacterium]